MMTQTYTPFYFRGEARASDILVLCDHAANTVPAAINSGDLGLPPKDMNRHIAYDLGAKGVAEHLCDMLQAPAIFSDFSRLVIDPNRGEDDPTLVMQIYDGSIIPANRHLDEQVIEDRLNSYHRPYHQAIDAHISKCAAPVLISIHSFTPKLNGRSSRPWHVGVLYSHDQRISAPLIAGLSQHPGIHVGDNQPYSGHLHGDTMDRHGLRHGNRHILIELRSDLIAAQDGQKKWAELLAPILKQAIALAPAD